MKEMRRVIQSDCVLCNASFILTLVPVELTNELYSIFIGANKRPTMKYEVNQIIQKTLQLFCKQVFQKYEKKTKKIGRLSEDPGVMKK